MKTLWEILDAIAIPAICIAGGFLLGLEIAMRVGLERGIRMGRRMEQLDVQQAILERLSVYRPFEVIRGGKK